MENSWEKADLELIKILNNDQNLAIVFQYIEYVILNSEKSNSGLSYNGQYYVPDIMYRFTKAMPYYTKFNIEQNLKILIENGWIIKDYFFAEGNHIRKSYGYKINKDLIRWEKEFSSLRCLANGAYDTKNEKKIKDLVNHFIFNIREAYKIKNS